MKLKKILALTLALAMSASLCACGGGEEAPAPEAEGGDAAATLKIGGIGPLTGAVATYGVATQRGAQIAVDEINAMEDKAFAIEYDFQDDTGVAETAVSAYNTLKDWGVDVIYGTTTTGPCITIASETNADRIFQLTPSASSPDVTAGKDNVFQMCFTDPNQGVTAANYVKDTGLATKVGVIYNNGDAYSTGIAQGFIAQCASLGIEVVTEQTFPADTNTDFNVQLTACKDGGAELVFMPIYYTPASLVLTQADAMGYDPIFFGGDGMDGILNIEGFDTALAEGLLLLTPFNAASEEAAGFVAKYQEAYGEVPNQFAADGYDCIYAIYNAVQQIEGALEMDQAALCDALIAVFTSADFSVDGLTGAGMTWQANGEVAKEALVVAVQEGAYVAQ
ncbi:MAG: ABC transporter substrate-binding protein [Ruminiclostridium sp.]|nr:ABC transporter substrate-binding protein [Ruminiclostridium sp.]